MDFYNYLKTFLKEVLVKFVDGTKINYTDLDAQSVKQFYEDFLVEKCEFIFTHKTAKESPFSIDPFNVKLYCNKDIMLFSFDFDVHDDENNKNFFMRKIFPDLDSFFTDWQWDFTNYDYLVHLDELTEVFNRFDKKEWDISIEY